MIKRGLRAGIIFTAILVLTSVSHAQSARLQDASYLRKLSLHVRGYSPDPIEYTELKEAQSQGNTTDFFRLKIASYLSSEDHAIKLTIRLEELFRLLTAPRLPSEKPPTSMPSASLHWDNALSDLFLRMAQKNLPWDELLKGKSYRLFPLRAEVFRYGFVGDFDFVRAVIPNIVPPIGQDVSSILKPIAPIDHSFANTDNRVAGAITTSRFFNRYTTTQLNKNRRRAAALFNIFLCDPMSAVIPPPPSSPDDGLDRAFPETSTIDEGDIEAIVKASDRHGSDAACAQCHYKLDPMGQVFMSSALVLAPRAAKGRLTFHEKKTGKLVDQPVLGLGALALAISQQPQYVDCQMRYFWNWFIGRDRPLSDTRRAELVRDFERVGRRTNDFIAILLESHEFRTRDFRAAEHVRADDVKAVLQNCNDCHSAKIPSFTAWPIGGDSVQMKHWSERISIRLDLEHDGVGRTMPPSWSSWVPSEKDLALLKAWFKDGAPNEKGEKQL